MALALSSALTSVSFGARSGLFGQPGRRIGSAGYSLSSMPAACIVATMAAIYGLGIQPWLFAIGTFCKSRMMTSAMAQTNGSKFLRGAGSIGASSYGAPINTPRTWTTRRFKYRRYGPFAHPFQYVSFFTKILVSVVASRFIFPKELNCYYTYTIYPIF